MKKHIPALLMMSLALGASVAYAHHSFSGTFQANKKIQITGVVTGFRFVNPHVGVDVMVTNPDGSTTQWLSEGAAATQYRRQGWTKDTFKQGETVRISGDSTRDGSPMISINSIEVLNPKDLSVVRTMGGQGMGAGAAAGAAAGSAAQIASLPLKLSDGRPNLTGAWTQNFANRSGPPRLTDVPYNAAGKALQAKYDPANDPQVFCDPPGLVRQAGFTPHPVRITQLTDRVVLEYEEYAGKREVFFKPVKPAPKAKSHLGNSIARYEGDALIIESNNLLGNLSSPDGHALSDKTTTVETYQRADDPKYGPLISMKMVATDPVYLTAPLTINQTKAYAENYEFIENNCRAPLRKRNAAPVGKATTSGAY